MSEPAKAPPAPLAPPPTSTSTGPQPTTPVPAASKVKPTAPAASRTNSNTSNGSAGNNARRGGPNARNRGPGAAKKDAAAPAAAAPTAGKPSSTPPASVMAGGGGGGGAAVNRRKSHSGQQATGRNASRPAAPTKQNSAPSVAGAAATGAPTLAPSATSIQNPRRAKSPAGPPVTAKAGRSNSKSNAAAAPAAKGSEMLDSLKRVITDLKAMPQTTNGGAAAAPAPVDGPGSQAKKIASPQPAPAAAVSPPSPVVASKAPNPNAPSFHPSRQPLDQLSEETEQDAPGRAARKQVPGGAAAAARQLPQGVQAQQPMGQFSAPRFQALQKPTAVEQEILGPTGRPVLAPTFTFGQRRQSTGQEAQQQHLQQQQAAMAAMSFDDVQQVMARSQSFAMGSEAPAQVVAPGMSALLGLAARAHRRTGSEMSPQMAQQVRAHRLSLSSRPLLAETFDVHLSRSASSSRLRSSSGSSATCFSARRSRPPRRSRRRLLACR
jgi:hypothetical protein